MPSTSVTPGVVTSEHNSASDLLSISTDGYIHNRFGAVKRKPEESLLRLQIASLRKEVERLKSLMGEADDGEGFEAVKARPGRDGRRDGGP